MAGFNVGRALGGWVSGSAQAYTDEAKSQKEWERKNAFLSNEHQKNIALQELRQKHAQQNQLFYDAEGKVITRDEEGNIPEGAMSESAALKGIEREAVESEKYRVTEEGKPIQKGQPGYEEALPLEVWKEKNKAKTPQSSVLQKLEEAKSIVSEVEKRTGEPFKYENLNEAERSVFTILGVKPDKSGNPMVDIDDYMKAINNEVERLQELPENAGKRGYFGTDFGKSEGKSYDEIREEAKENVRNDYESMGIRVPKLKKADETKTKTKETKQRTIIKRGKDKSGRAVVKYSDGSIEYAD